jgi:hypothetical protein
MSQTLRGCLINEITEGDKGWISEWRKSGELTGDVYGDSQFILLGSISQQELAWTALDKYKLPLFVYCWDFYKWAWEGDEKPEGDWKKYKLLLEKAERVFVPSKAQQLRLKEMLDVESTVIPASVGVYEHQTRDLGYVLDPVRDYPEENKGWVERACFELDIPYHHPNHSLTEAEFRKEVSECSFLTCAYREASTGGLTLLEGMWNGKPSLVSNSPYMGASDYLGKFGYYFQYDSYDDLKRNIAYLWDQRPKISKEVARAYIASRFTPAVFARKLKEAIHEVLRVS